MTGAQSLPAELLRRCLEPLDYRSLLAAAGTSREWREVRMSWRLAALPPKCLEGAKACQHFPLLPTIPSAATAHLQAVQCENLWRSRYASDFSRSNRMAGSRLGSSALGCPAASLYAEAEPAASGVSAGSRGWMQAYKDRAGEDSGQPGNAGGLPLPGACVAGGRVVLLPSSVLGPCVPISSSMRSPA